MKKFRTLLTSLIVLLCALTTSAHDFEVDGIYYDITSSSDLTVSVTYQGNDPSSYSNEYSGSVVIPEKVTYDSKEYSVTSIGEDAFYGCSGLTSVTIPNSVTSIGNSAFEGCKGLTAVHITDLSAWCKIKFYGYHSNPTNYAHHLYLNGEEILNLVIPDDITSIGNHAFSGCSGLTSVTIANSVTSIGEYAFYGCSGLTSVTIPNSVTSIGSSAFRGCSGLTSVTIPNSVTSIGEIAFYGCSDLTSVTIPNSVTSIGYSAFSGCSGLTSVDIPNSVTSIGSYAFQNCSGLTSVTIPNSVTSIGNDAFVNCSGLTSVTIPNSVTSIGNSAFSGTGWYNNHSDGILYLDSWLIGYKGDKPTGTLEIKEGTRGIANNAFYGCSGLTSINIPNSVTSIGQYTFWNCSGLTSVTIPNSVTSIGNCAFYDCSGLTSVTIPNSVTSIGNCAFYDCSGLTSIYIPESVTRISQEAFYGCSRITRIDCMAATPPLVYNNTFSSSIYTKATLNVPEGSVEKYKVANIWKEFTNMTAGGSELKQCAAPVITYADGKLQFACETAGAECKYTLTAKDIQTAFITASNNSVDLTACYDITAYAVAEGYKNSEQVTAMLYWINGSDVSTNINQTEMRGVMATCSGGIITVSGLTDGEAVMFYDANGALLYTGTAQNGTISYAPSTSGVIIVKIGTTSIKVVS